LLFDVSAGYQRDHLFAQDGLLLQWLAKPIERKRLYDGMPLSLSKISIEVEKVYIVQSPSATLKALQYSLKTGCCHFL